MIVPSYVEVKKSGFDNYGQLSFDKPKDCNLIILLGNSGRAYIPFSCILPHQTYKGRLMDVFNTKHFEVVSALPVNSNNIFPIAYKNLYSEQRWSNAEEHKEDEQVTREDKLASLLEEALQVIKYIEFEGKDSKAANSFTVAQDSACPACGQLEKHHKGCVLGNFLKKVKKEIG